LQKLLAAKHQNRLQFLVVPPLFTAGVFLWQQGVIRAIKQANGR
jgi:hypothetical protein